MQLTREGVALVRDKAPQMPSGSQILVVCHLVAEDGEAGLEGMIGLLLWVPLHSAWSLPDGVEDLWACSEVSSMVKLVLQMAWMEYSVMHQLADAFLGWTL